MKKHDLIKWIEMRFNKMEELAIPLDLYFQDNHESCCTILCNTGQLISSQVFFKKLVEIKNNGFASEIFVRYAGHEDALEDETCWVNSDSIWLVTKRNIEEIREVFKEFQPSTVDFAECETGIACKDDEEIVEIWWD